MLEIYVLRKYGLKYRNRLGHSFFWMPWLLTLVRPTERGSTQFKSYHLSLLQLTNLDAMSKSESDSKKSVAVEDDDEPDEW